MEGTRTRGHEGWRTRGMEGTRAGGPEDTRARGPEGARTRGPEGARAGGLEDRRVRGLEGQRDRGPEGRGLGAEDMFPPPGNGCARAVRSAAPTLRRLRLLRTRRRASTQCIPCQLANGSTGQLCFPLSPCHLAHVSPPKATPSLPPSERGRRYLGSSRRARRSRPTRAGRGVPVGAAYRRLPRAGCAPRPNHS